MLINWQLSPEANLDIYGEAGGGEFREESTCGFDGKHVWDVGARRCLCLKLELSFDNAIFIEKGFKKIVKKE